MFVPLNKSKKYKWDQYSLVYPSICVANLGQLALDLIIYSFKATKVGYINHESILPLIGNDPFKVYDEKKCLLTLTSEVYESSKHKLIFIQQRSSFVMGRRKVFLKALVNWIKKHNFIQVINLTATYSYLRNDKQLIQSPFRFLCSPQIEEKFGHTLLNYKWISLEESESDTILSNEHMLDDFVDIKGYVEEKSMNTQLKSLNLTSLSNVDYPKTQDYVNIETIKYKIFGGGISINLFNICLNEAIPIMILIKFCDEGDNQIDAIELAKYFLEYIQLLTPKYNYKLMPIIMPPSWINFFGSQQLPQIY